MGAAGRGAAHAEEAHVDLDRMRALGPGQVRAMLGDGSFGGLYQRDDDEMQALWDVGVAEARAVIAGPWE